MLWKISPNSYSKPRPSILLVFATAVLVIWTIIAILGQLSAPHDPGAFVTETFASASCIAWLGGDYLGRDLLSRILVAARLTLCMGLAATVLAYLLGVTLGIAAAAGGGLFDNCSSRIVDLVLSLPKMIVGLLAVAAFGSSVSVIVLISALVYAASVYRVARALGGDVAHQDFIMAARARGEGIVWISIGEILPNIIAPLAADFALRFGFAILFISSLSFLGVGVQPPAADWGTLVRENMAGLSLGSLAAVYPALAIASVTVSSNLIVDILSGKRRRVL